MNHKLWARGRLVLGVLFSAAALILALRGIDWRILGSTLRQVHLGWLLAAVAVEILTLWINAIRWRWLFWPHYRPHTGRLFAILGVAQMANMVLPGRLGLPLRVVLVGEGGKVNRGTALTTLLVEKVLEGVTLLPIGILLFLTLDLPEWLRVSAVLSGVLLLVLLLLVACAVRWKDRLLAWLDKRPSWLSNISQALLDGLDALRSVHNSARLWALSYLYWAVVAAVNWLVIRAVGLGTSSSGLPLVAILVLLFVLQIGVRLPSSPGSIGVFDYLGVVSLSLFGVERAPALAAMFVLHLVFYLPPSLVGVGYLIWTSTGLGQLRRAALTFQEN